MDTTLLLIRLFLFGVFALAGIGKLLDRQGSRNSMRAFAVPESMVNSFAAVLPFVELAIAFALLFTPTYWYAGIAAFVLLLVFIGGMLLQIQRGKAPDCHCFGQIHSEPVGIRSVLRNVGFAAAALFVAIFGIARPGIPVGENVPQVLQSVLLLSGLVGIAVLVSYAVRLTNGQTKLLRRIELLELLGGGETQVERQEAGNPIDGLPIGAPFPDFEITNAIGKKVTLNALLSAGKPILFLFVGPNCRPCRSLVPEIAAWSSELRERLRFILVSTGTPADNLEKFAAADVDEILLQDSRELALSVSAKWTPTAIVVLPNGKVASHPAVGDNTLRSFIERIRTADMTNEFVHFANSNGNDAPQKIGLPVPDFSLSAVNGENITSADMKGKKTLAVFMSTGCGHCHDLLADIRKWEAAGTMDDVNVIIFSEGSVKEHRELGMKAPILLEKGYKTAAGLGMRGTPSAVLINENGIIASEAAIGPPNIKALIGRMNEKI